MASASYLRELTWSAGLESALEYVSPARRQNSTRTAAERGELLDTDKFSVGGAKPAAGMQQGASWPASAAYPKDWKNRLYSAIRQAGSTGELYTPAQDKAVSPTPG